MPRAGSRAYVSPITLARRRTSVCKCVPAKGGGEVLCRVVPETGSLQVAVVLCVVFTRIVPAAATAQVPSSLNGPRNVFLMAPAMGMGNGSAQFVTVGDSNGDGKPDFVTVSGNGFVSVFLGRGDGTFQPPVITSACNPSRGAFGDVNGDGKADLVVVATGYSLALVHVLLGNGDSTFRAFLQKPESAKGASSVSKADQTVDGFVSFPDDQQESHKMT